MNKTKIFIITNNDSTDTNNKDWEYLFVGYDKPKDDSHLFDCVGDNISSLNSLYNELTGIYWVYKHLDEFDEYSAIGFCHYSRIFIDYKKPILVAKHVPSGTFEKHFLLEQNEIICPYPVVVDSIEKQYSKAHNKEDIEILKKTIHELYPNMEGEFEQYLKSNNSFLYNMFVMPKDVFKGYCEFVFPVLDKIVSSGQNRSSRLYISERLTGFYLFHLSNKGYLLKNQPICLIRKKNIKQAFRSSNDRIKLGEDHSFLYRIKPLWLYLLPMKVEQCLRNRQRKK